MDFRVKDLCAISLLALSSSVSIWAQKDFLPDTVFKGPTLTGWHTLGSATWNAKEGSIEGNGASGNGWLVSDKKFQDVRVYLRLSCKSTCSSGVLLRALQTKDHGLEGIFVSLSDADLNTYAITLDAQGNETKRVKLAEAPPEVIGISPQQQANQAPAASRVPRIRRKMASLAGPGAGNTVELIIDNEAVNGSVNDGALVGGNVEANGYGSIAIYVGKDSEAHIDGLAYKDINTERMDREFTSTHFTKQRLSSFYYGWSAVAADTLHRAALDVVAGPYIYLAPDYTVRKLYRSGRSYNPSLEYAPDMVNFAYDFNGDGWPDILASDIENGQRPLDIYVNPQGESRRWNKYRAVSGVSSELVLFKDIDGDGKPEVLFGGGGMYAYAKPDPEHLDVPWKVTPISGHLDRLNNHGMGVGDINGDGRLDLIVPSGWFEHPPAGSGPKEWTFHEADFGGGGGEMGIYDVNSDGMNDVVTSLAAHGFGLAWFEQKRAQDGKTTFEKHDIAGDFTTKNAGDVVFSQPHAAAFADMDGDGVPDMVVGKSMYHHLEGWGDPDPYGQPALYVYRTVREKSAPGGAYFVPELVDNQSGVGSAMQIVDLNHDGANDILTQSVLGTFVFYGHSGRWPAASASKPAGKR